MVVTKTLVPGGHAFVLDENGPFSESDLGLKDYELRDYHNTIRCVKCEDYFCDLCRPSVLTEKCPEDRPTLPGLEFD